MRISTFIYLFLISGAFVAAGLLSAGVGEQVSFVLGYVVVFLVAVELYRRRKWRFR